MRNGYPVIAADPLLFGRKRMKSCQEALPLVLADDVRLFATTFAAGFAFVAVLIA